MNALIHSAPGASELAEWPTIIKGLADALGGEKRLIDELIVAMSRQRQAVAADDLQSIDDSVFAVQRILLTLGEARKRRRTLNSRLGQSPDISLRDLVEALGPHATDELLEAREVLQGAAQKLAREVATNRQILRQALANGEELVRTLTGTSGARVGYGEKSGPRDSAGSSFIVNRRV